MAERKFMKIKLHLSGDIRTVPVEEADILVKTKRASLVRESAREKAVKDQETEKAVK